MDEMILVIGNKNYSSWSMRAWVAMKHFDIPFQERLLPLFTNQFHTELAALGCSTVPVLSNVHHHLSDSLAILETLAEYFPNMWPQNPVLKAKAREACAMMHSGFMAMRSELHMNCRANKRTITISDACRSDLDKIETLWQNCLAVTAQHRTSEAGYLFGEFSIADAFFAPVAVRMQGYDVAIQPATQTYVNHLLANQAVAQWVAQGKADNMVLPQEEVGDAVNE